jgi:Lrp/AsnC family leucine-responsive transcriptional regulator
MQGLDDIDKKILARLQENNRITAEKLGKLLHLSTSAVQRRLTRLRNKKIIEADIAVVSPAAAGMGFTCVVEVSLELGNSKVIEGFKKMSSACPEIMQCYYVAGTYDFILIVSTKDMQHYEYFSKKHLMDNPSVKQYYTHVVLDRVKVKYGPAI